MEPVDSGKYSWKKQFNPLAQVCVTRTCLNSGTKEAGKLGWATKYSAGGQETGEKQVLLLWLVTYCRTLECLQCLCVYVLPAAVSATWSMSDTHTGRELWSQFLPPGSCWWLLVTPFPSNNSCRKHPAMKFREPDQNMSSTAGSVENKLLTADFSKSLC